MFQLGLSLERVRWVWISLILSNKKFQKVSIGTSQKIGIVESLDSIQSIIWIYSNHFLGNRLISVAFAIEGSLMLSHCQSAPINYVRNGKLLVVFWIPKFGSVRKVGGEIWKNNRKISFFMFEFHRSEETSRHPYQNNRTSFGNFDDWESDGLLMVSHLKLNLRVGAFWFKKTMQSQTDLKRFSTTCSRSGCWNARLITRLGWQSHNRAIGDYWISKTDQQISKN